MTQVLSAHNKQTNKKTQTVPNITELFGIKTV